MSRKGWVLFLAMSVIWGIPYLLIKEAVDVLSPSLVVFLRTLIGGLVLLPVAAARGELLPALRHWRWLVPFTLVEITVPWLLLTDAETKVSSSYAGLLVAAVPLIGAVLAVLTGAADQVSRRRMVGLLVGFGGVAALLELDFAGAHGQVKASVFILLTALGYAIGPIIIAHALADVPSFGVMAAAMAFNTIVYAPFAAHDWPGRWPAAHVVWSVVGLGVVCTATAFVLFFALIAEVGPQRATVITYLNPAVAVLLGVSLRGEAFTAGMAVGFPLVLFGCWLATAKPRAVAPPPMAEALAEPVCVEPS